MQLSVLSAAVAAPEPLRLTVCVLPADESLTTVITPDAVPAEAGSNWTVTDADCPGFSVAGTFVLASEKPVPVTVRLLSVTACVPVELKVTVFVAAVFRTCEPNARLVVLNASVGVTAFSCRANVAVPPAVSVAVCVVVTEAAVAVKLAVVDPAATVTLAGTVTAVSLLTNATLWPPVGAAPLSVTAQASVPAPVRDVLVQLRLDTVRFPTTPLPPNPTDVDFLRPLASLATVPFMSVVLVVVPVLSISNEPAAAPAAAGVKATCTFRLAPAASFTGRFMLPITANELPVTERLVISTDCVPGFVTVTVDLEVTPTSTDPKPTALGEAETVPSALEDDREL